MCVLYVGVWFLLMKHKNKQLIHVEYSGSCVVVNYRVDGVVILLFSCYRISQELETGEHNPHCTCAVTSHPVFRTLVSRVE